MMTFDPPIDQSCLNNSSRSVQYSRTAVKNENLEQGRNYNYLRQLAQQYVPSKP